MTNELQNFNTETGEIIELGDTVVSETNDYRVIKNQDGTFSKQMKFESYMSRQPESDEEKIELYKVFNDSDSELVTKLSSMVGSTIVIKHVFIQPYESFNEKDGSVTQGVVTTIEDDEGKYYATSSKSVYYSLKNIFQTFGVPSSDIYKPVKVEVTGTKQVNGLQINIKLVGLA